MYKLSRGRLWRLVALLCLFTAFLSAFLDNVTTILLVVPVTMQLCHVLDVDPVLPVMSLVFFSNIGEAVFFLSFCSVEKLQAEPQLRLVILQTFCWCRILDCSCIPRVRSTLVRRRILNFVSSLFSFLSGQMTVHLLPGAVMAGAAAFLLVRRWFRAAPDGGGAAAARQHELGIWRRTAARVVGASPEELRVRQELVRHPCLISSFS